MCNSAVLLSKCRQSAERCRAHDDHWTRCLVHAAVGERPHQPVVNGFVTRFFDHQKVGPLAGRQPCALRRLGSQEVAAAPMLSMRRSELCTVVWRVDVGEACAGGDNLDLR